MARGQTLWIHVITGMDGFGGNIWNNSEPGAAVLWTPNGSEVSRYYN